MKKPTAKQAAVIIARARTDVKYVIHCEKVGDAHGAGAAERLTKEGWFAPGSGPLAERLTGAGRALLGI